MEKGHQVCYGVLPCVTRIPFSLKQWGDTVVTQGMFKSGNSYVLYMLPWTSISILKWQNKKQTELERDMQFISLKNVGLLEFIRAAFQALEFFTELLNPQSVCNTILHLTHWDSVSAETLITSQSLNKETATLMES